MNFPIKYANCWEDPKMLLSTFPEKTNARIFSIASGGDNSFALLLKSPAFVLCADMNPAQIYLCELKKAALQTLDYEQCLEFMGFKTESNRIQTFARLQNLLSPEALKFWSENQQAIASGIIHFGKFENYFKIFRSKVLPWIHSESRLTELLKSKSQEAQKSFYNKQWNTWRWRLLFKIFFSRPVMAKFGRSKAYLNQVNIPVGSYIFNQAEKELSHLNAQQNYFLHAICTGHFRPDLPIYLQQENFEKVKSEVHKIHFFHGSADDALLCHEAFDFYNFSNIFEYMDLATFEKFGTMLRKTSKPGSRIAYWNLMVDRIFSEINSKHFHKLPCDLHDHGFFYKRFVAEEIT